MRKIYFDKRCLMICEYGDPALSDPNAICFHTVTEAGITSLAEMMTGNCTLSKVCIPTDDVESTYSMLKSCFKEVNAGGGVVANRRGDILLIRRNGMWDLPKGHQEEGEDIEITSVREVQEETGVEDLELGKLICITDHCYLRGGEWYLKHTWWYEMFYGKPVDLTPQTEEDISKAAWIARSSLPSILKDSTYPSIMEVFRREEKFK